MKKKRILISALTVLIVAVAAFQSIIPSYSSVLEGNWGFALPVKALCKEVYAADTGASFHGDGIRYHVFSYQNGAAIEAMLPWSDAEGTTLSWTQDAGEEKRYHSYSEDVNTWLESLHVPKEYYPAFEGAAYWYDKQEDHSQIIIIWDRDGNRLYIAENFI